jgi:inorganic triphosphatase YgiF
LAHEVELKLRIAREDAARLRKHPAVLAACVGKPVTRKLTSIYYDTPDLKLLDAGISLRVRRMAGGWFQAVKAAGSSLAGLHQRMEWEDVITSGQPDFTRIVDPQLARIFDDQPLRDALTPIFRTEVMRTEWQLAFDNGDKVELALDLGQLVAGGKREPISEIELELKGGNTGRLFDLALLLQHDIPLVLENVSKAQRGYAHYRPQPPAIAKASPPRLAPQTDAGAAFGAIAWECITQLQGNQDIVLHGADIEGVHQMRVALRRLRSAFALFKPLLGGEEKDALLAEIRWITDLLGTARDLDAFLDETLPPLLAHFDRHAGLLKLQSRAVTARRDAYAGLRRALESQRYQRLLLALGAWLENAPWSGGTNESQTVREFADAMLARRYKQLRRHGKRLMHMHAEERHQTRIAAKKLRYAAEFFSSLYAAGRTRAFVRRLALVQDRLGVLNDIAVTEQLLQKLAGKRPDRHLAEAAFVFAGWNASHAMHSLEHMDTAWRKFSRQKTFWR